MIVRVLAGALSINRTGFGMAYLLKPADASRSWIGRVARDPATQVFIRGHGARDLALGAGALVALARRDDRGARVWLAGQALADSADIVSTLAARKRLPRQGFRFALGMAAVSTAVATAAAAALGTRWSV